MTETFTASNGWYTDAVGNIRDSNGFGMVDYIKSGQVEQFFQEKRDAELGRWRDKEHPEWVCYPDGADGVLVLNEKGGSTCVWPRALAARSFGGEITGEEIAARYFQAHPVRKPLPTKPGLYVNRGELATYPSSASVLKRDFRDRWTFYGTPDGAEDIARVWHDAGELVRIVPEYEGENK